MSSHFQCLAFAIKMALQRRQSMMSRFWVRGVGSPIELALTGFLNKSFPFFRRRLRYRLVVLALTICAAASRTWRCVGGCRMRCVSLGKPNALQFHQSQAQESRLKLLTQFRAAGRLLQRRSRFGKLTHLTAYVLLMTLKPLRAPSCARHPVRCQILTVAGRGTGKGVSIPT